LETSTQRTSHRPHPPIASEPYRNFRCEKYDDCLARAAYSNRLFDCSKCRVAGINDRLQPIRDVPRVRRRLVVEDGCVGSVEAARMLGIKVSQLQHMRYQGTGPEHCQIGKTGTAIVYDIEVIRKFILDRAKGDPVNAAAVTEVSTPAAAEILGISIATLCRMRRNNSGPPYRRVGNKCMYNMRVLAEHKKQQGD